MRAYNKTFTVKQICRTQWSVNEFQSLIYPLWIRWIGWVCWAPPDAKQSDHFLSQTTKSINESFDCWPALSPSLSPVHSNVQLPLVINAFPNSLELFPPVIRQNFENCRCYSLGLAVKRTSLTEFLLELFAKKLTDHHKFPVLCPPFCNRSSKTVSPAQLEL